MNIQGLIKRYEKFKASKKKLTSVDLVLKDLRSLDEPEPLPFKLKDVVRRIRGFDPTTQIRWLIDILKELGDDYGSMKYRSGYEQGKLEGAWVGNQLKDADKIRRELNKVKVPQFIADKIEYCKQTDGYSLFYAMDYCYNFNDCAEWLESNEDKFARAWLDGYEVENRYRVKMKGIVNALSFLSYHKKADIWTVTDINNSNDHRTHHTRKELEEAGFSEVFNSPLFETVEVE